MLSILKSDFYKLRKSKTFLICLLACVVLTIVAVSAMQSVPDMFTYTGGTGALVNLLPMNTQLYFIAAFVAIFITSEFHYGTIKTIISRGSGRGAVFFSKFIVCSFASIALLLVFMLTTVALGSVMWGFDPDGIATFSGFVKIVSLQSLMTIAYTALFTLLAMAIRSLGGALVANFICVVMAATIFEVVNLGGFWLDWGISRFSTFAPNAADMTQGIMTALAWGVVSIVASLILFVKQDIK